MSFYCKSDRVMIVIMCKLPFSYLFQTQKETSSVEDVSFKKPRRVPKSKKPSNNTQVKPRRNRNHQLFSQNPAELLSETPADDSKTAIPVSIVNVHADKAKDKAKQKTHKKEVSEKPPQIGKIEEAVGSSQPAATQRRKIVPRRRSTLEFVDEKKKTKKKKKKKRNDKKSSDDETTFVCTSRRKEDVDLMKQLASRFGIRN